MNTDIMKFYNLVKFIFALKQGNYVTVTEISRFIEFLLGTHTNTVNRMLCTKGREYASWSEEIEREVYEVLLDRNNK